MTQRLIPTPVLTAHERLGEHWQKYWLEPIALSELPPLKEQYRLWKPLEWYSPNFNVGHDGDREYKGVAFLSHTPDVTDIFEFKAYEDEPKGSVRLFSNMPYEHEAEDAEIYGKGMFRQFSALMSFFKFDLIGGMQRFQIDEDYGPRDNHKFDALDESVLPDLLLKELWRVAPLKLTVEEFKKIILDRHDLTVSDHNEKYLLPDHSPMAWINDLPPWEGSIERMMQKYVLGHHRGMQDIWGEDYLLFEKDEDGRISMLPRGVDRLKFKCYIAPDAALPA